MFTAVLLINLQQNFYCNFAVTNIQQIVHFSFAYVNFQQNCPCSLGLINFQQNIFILIINTSQSTFINFHKMLILTSATFVIFPPQRFTVGYLNLPSCNLSRSLKCH